MKLKNNIKFFIFTGLFCALFFAVDVKANLLNGSLDFYVSKNHDQESRNQISAQLVKVTPKIYFYVERQWWAEQTQARQSEILNNFNNLYIEFENKIYPKITSLFGYEAKPGIDNEDRITILFHRMIEDAGGYFRSVDGYYKLQIPNSNEKEMFYLPIEQIESSQLKVFVAHELMHLITFNQKEKIFNIQEDVWLNEARAEYISTFLGYDDNYEGSNLQRRVRAFLEKPSDSLTDWQDNKYDYGVINLFINYLVDHYGVDVLSNSLKSKYSGLESINYALKIKGIKDDFSQIFINWTIAVILNDCSYNSKYCYLNKNLKNLKINPVINFLPLQGNSSLSVTNLTKNWSSSWQKIIGGSGELTLNFEGLKGLNFKVPYIVYKKNGSYYVDFIKIDENQKGKISISDFGDKITSLIIIPSLISNKNNLNGFEPNYPYTFSVLTKSTEISKEDAIKIQELLEQIDYLKKEIAKILEQQGKNPPDNLLGCQILNDLYFGISGQQVRCLQGFLKQQGQDIYPEGLVTGYFGELTKLAVIRFQNKYAFEILQPIGLQQGTGYVGEKTKQKINQLSK